MIRCNKQVAESKFQGGNTSDLIFKKTNPGQHNGVVGLLANDLVARQALYEQALMPVPVPVPVPFFNRGLYMRNVVR